MPLIDYYITDRKCRFEPIHRTVTAIDKALALPKAYSYLVGIDQSTTCTGIYIQDTNDTINFICDFHRMESAPEYIEKLILFLKKLLRNRDVKLFVYEALPEGLKKNRVLESLHTLILNLRTSDQVFTKLDSKTFDDIPPVMWESHIYDKAYTLSSNAFHSKMEKARCVCVRKPNLVEFFNKVQSKDYDAFDACGILLGYLDEHYLNGTFDPALRRIGGQIKYFDDIFITAIPMNYTTLEFLKEDIYDMFSLIIPEEGTPFLHWNNDDSVIHNIRKALTYDDRVFTLVTKPQDELSLMYRYNIDLSETDKIVLFLCKSKDLKSYERSMLERGEVFKCELFK